MAKFDVYHSDASVGYLLDCQSDLLGGLNTRFVVPLMPVAEAPKMAARLNPVFEVNGVVCAMVTQYAASIPVVHLREAVMSLEQHDFTIGNALDMLISGY